MLQLDPDPTFTWPVEFNSPKGKQTLKLAFKHKTVDEHNAWWDAAAKRFIAFQEALRQHAETITQAAQQAEKDGKPIPDQPPAPKPQMTALDEIMDIVVGWEDVSAEFSRDAMAKLLANYHDLSAKKICEAWSAGLAGRRLEN